MRRVLAALVALTALLSLTACDPEDTSNNRKHQAGPEATAGKGEDKKEPEPEKTKAPEKHETPDPDTVPEGQVGLFVTWESQNDKPPVCEWSKNNKSFPCEGMSATHDADSPGYYGFWETTQAGKAGDTFSVAAQGTGAMKSITCEAFWQDAPHEGPTNGKRCSVTLTLG